MRWGAEYIQMQANWKNIKIAFQSGSLELPSTLVMEKQRVIIDELKDKIHLPAIDNLNKLSNDELKKAVDSAIMQVSCNLTSTSSFSRFLP